ncbi:MAG: hypothetical protein ACE5FH_03265 [Candidatus Zixiibacteriota bacterium]
MKVRDVVARVKLSRMKGQVQPQPLSFPQALMRPKHVLVCLPGGLRELTIVKQFLPAVTELFRPADISLLCIPGVKVTDIFPRKGFQILAPSIDQLTWSGLPKKDYLQLLRDYKFDMVLDFNLEPSNFVSTVLLNLPGAVRVGRGNHLGEPYYNLELKTKYLRDERNIYRSIIEMLETIKNSAQNRLRPSAAS